MDACAVRAENLGKRYYISGAHAKEERLVAYLTCGAKQLAGNLRNLLGGQQASFGAEEVWALRDVSFEVERGEVVGFVGANGAGKSTLLKILSRITEPTVGQASLRGRVGSLLEVGTGFHEDLTGRKNVYLSGAILGLSRAEIEARFDEIVEFSEIGKFLDTPIKRYSSGMRIRLGFAVAAHLNPEILIVDEVLAVGDASFRQKCMGKMGDVAKGGRTVLFVSHNMGQIRRLCDRVIWLDGGRIRMIGNATDVSMAYEAAAVAQKYGGYEGVFLRPQPLALPVWIRKVTLHGGDGNPCAGFNYGDDLVMDVELACGEGFSAGGFSQIGVVWRISDENDTRISSGESEWMDQLFDPSRGAVRCKLNKLPLYRGAYKISLELFRATAGHMDNWRDAATFQISSCLPSGSKFEIDNRHGHTFINHSWEVLNESKG